MKKSLVLLFFLISFKSFAGDYCVFPFENKGEPSLNYLKYGFEIYIEAVLQEDICERINALDNMDIPLQGNYTLATKIVAAKNMDANYLIVGEFSGDKDNLTLTLKIYELDGIEKKYTFKGSLETILNKSLKSFFSDFKGFQWPFGEKLEVQTFEKFVKISVLLCLDKNAFLADEYLKYLKGNDFYLREIFLKLYSTGEFELAEKYFNEIKKKNWEDFLVEGLINVKNKNYEKAIDYFKKGNALNPSDIFLNNIAGCYLLTGRYEVAETVFPFDNTNCLFLLNGAIVSFLNRDYGKTKSLLKDFCAKYGTVENAGYLITALLKEKGISTELFDKPTDNIDFLTNFQFLRFNKCPFEDISGVIEDYKKKANQYFNDGKKNRANEYFKKVILINPFDKSVLEILCKDYNDRGYCELLNFLRGN